MLKRTLAQALTVLMFIGFWCGSVLSQVVAFKDVKIMVHTSGKNKPEERDGVFNIDRTGKAIVCVKDDRVILTVPFDWITNIVYEAKNNRLLTVQYKDKVGEGQFAQFKLNTGSRDNLLATLEAASGIQISRSSGK